MYRIYIVEDDRTIANTVKNNLEQWGLQAKCTENFKDIMGNSPSMPRTLCLWISGCPFTTVFTTAQRYAGSQRYPWFFCHRLRTT